MPKMSGAQALLESLERQNVDTIFGILGGAILPVYDALCGTKKIRHILARHEQCAAHEAEGYARASGRAGVCMATSGSRRHKPGHRNRKRLHGFQPRDCSNRTNPNIRRQFKLHDWQRRIPRSRHLRHHHSNYKIQLPATLSNGNSPNGY